MAIINFWIDANIDGRETILSGGPRSKEGGMGVKIKQRNCGSITTALDIRCFEDEGTLKILVYDGNSKLVYEHETER